MSDLLSQHFMQTPFRLELQEWESRDICVANVQLLDLLAIPSKLLSVQPLSQNRVRISSGSIVGRCRSKSIDVLIRPKCPIPTLLGLLTEVHELAGLVPNLVGYDTSTEIVDLLIQIFLQQVDQLVRGGLKKSYLDFEEELTAVRDRIDVRQTMTSQLRGRPKVFCRFEEFSLDGPENRTLLATLWTIVRCAAVLPERRRFAHRLTADFEHVSTIQVEPVNPTTIQCDRLTMHYEPVLRLAHVILASLGITHEFGHLQAEGFQLNMNSLFEKFVFRRLRKELTPQSLRVTDQTSFDFDEQSQANIRPDILIRSRSGKRLVADTKYKLSSKPDPDDLYQILAYCRVLQIDRGLLITAGSSTNLTYSVRDGQTTIDVVSVDLSGSLDDVHESMQKLAQFIIDCLHKPA